MVEKIADTKIKALRGPKRNLQNEKTHFDLLLQSNVIKELERLQLYAINQVSPNNADNFKGNTKRIMKFKVHITGTKYFTKIKYGNKNISTKQFPYNLRRKSQRKTYSLDVDANF